MSPYFLYSALLWALVESSALNLEEGVISDVVLLAEVMDVAALSVPFCFVWGTLCGSTMLLYGLFGNMACKDP